MSREERPTPSQALAELVREASREARLIGRRELALGLVAEGFLVESAESAAASAAAVTLESSGKRDVSSPPGVLHGPDFPPVASIPAAPENAALLAVAALADQALAENEDLAALLGPDNETYYHCPPLLSRTYAAILARKGSPLSLMAETIRVESRDYPRPVPLDLFEAPPFDLTPEAIEASLRAMAKSPEHADIAFTETSAGGIYLFSTRHLEPGYAAFLAERFDVGLAGNP